MIITLLTIWAQGSLVTAAESEDHVRQMYFGELHVHTQFSPDAFLFGVRSTPNDAYRFAQGEAITHASGQRIQLRQPLDFIAVTDHAEYMGVLPTLTREDSPLAQSEIARQINSQDPEVSASAWQRVLMSMAGKPFQELIEPRLRQSLWQESVAAANRHNQPGTFTTLLGYEWTSSGGKLEDGATSNLHRNILFRTGAAPELPFSSFDSPDPSALWRWMDRQRASGIDLMAIPHNSNLSDGLMFPEQTSFGGQALDSSYAKTRARNEPLVEITQIKGTSETHPLLSPNDEWADFEILPDKLGGTGELSRPGGSYVRRAWQTGLKLQERLGTNPYRFGVVGASDGHNASSQVEEDNYHGKIGTADGTPSGRRGGSIVNKHHVLYSASGLTGVWAASNSRESIYDALARREVFATTGPRIGIRFFGGWHIDESFFTHPDWTRSAYLNSVPMGAELRSREPDSNSPSFATWTIKDPASAWLQRVQIVKGWIEADELFEKVYDVACGDGNQPDPTTHRCPDNGASVDLDTCDFDKQRGSTQLRSVWTDPAFEAHQPAFYYVRVLENPSCRWSTWDSLRHGLPVSDKVPAVIQERAYSSPIWYNPPD